MTTNLMKKKPFRKHEAPIAESDKYIDLGEMSFEDEAAALGEGAIVKVAEIFRYEDVVDFVNEVYNGNILVIDYTSIANDELSMKRMSDELKNVCRDSNGDVAGIGKNLLIVTPRGIAINRTKLKGNL